MSFLLFIAPFSYLFLSFVPQKKKKKKDNISKRKGELEKQNLSCALKQESEWCYSVRDRV